jgi:hypothetical protein
MPSVNATSWPPAQVWRGQLAEIAVVMFEFFLGWSEDADWLRLRTGHTVTRQLMQQ